MLKKLRRKFILISMLSVFFVLASTIAAINISNYASIENSSKSTLTEIIKNGLDDKGPEDRSRAPGDGEKPPEGGVPEKPGFRQSNYFISVFDANGNLKDYNYNHIFYLSEKQCKDLSLKVYKNQLTGRRYETFRFTKEVKNKLTYVAFVDIKLELENANKFLLISSLVSVGSYALLFGLIIIASRIAFKPSEDAYKKQKKFITNASHELKTPLTIISADLDLIELDNGKSEWSDSIRSQVEKLTTMTSQLVELSRLEEEEKSNYPFEDFSVNEVCGSAIRTFGPSFKKEKIKFSYNISEDLKMYGNKHLIEKLLYIFLDNSLKYTGGENKTSDLVINKNSRGKIQFVFSNTLSSDDETDPKLITERFYRAPSNKKEGSGIGLSIAQEIVSLHKGKIKVDKSNFVLSFYITFE